MSISTMYGNPAGWHAVFTESWAVVLPQFILAPIDAALPGGILSIEEMPVFIPRLTIPENYGGNTSLPEPIKLLKVEARVCKVGSLMFLLLGPKYYQICRQGVKRIGRIGLTVVPNNELRTLNIYYKYADSQNTLDSR